MVPFKMNLEDLVLFQRYGIVGYSNRTTPENVPKTSPDKPSGPGVQPMPESLSTGKYEANTGKL